MRKGDLYTSEVIQPSASLMPSMSYEQKEDMLNVGEAALFYSDGLVEAHDSQRRMFGFPRLRALVAKHGQKGTAPMRRYLSPARSLVPSFTPFGFGSPSRCATRG